jgi:hypothetical protein
MWLPSQFFPDFWGRLFAIPSVLGVKAKMCRECVIASSYQFDAFKKCGRHQHIAQEFADQNVS